MSFSDEERRAKELVASYMQEAGLSVQEDAVGSLIGRREDKDADAPAVPSCSSSRFAYRLGLRGGIFDGALGVLSGIEALQAMEEQGISTNHSVEVIAFTDEEGARFGFGFIGSRAMADMLKAEDLERSDDTGVSISEAMAACGYGPRSISEAARGTNSIKAYTELHIEQGKVLEAENIPVGIVEGVASNLWLRFTVEGEAGHAGTTPMSLRHDALAATARLLRIIEENAKVTGSTGSTVGQIRLRKGVPDESESPRRDRDTARGRIPHEVVDDLAVAGTAEHVRSRVSDVQKSKCSVPGTIYCRLKATVDV